MSTSKPTVLVMADVPQWAWGRKALALQQHLSDDFDITVWYLKHGSAPDHFDLYHTFDFPNVQWSPPGKRAVTGTTAHVLRTWGPQKIQHWARGARAIHVNSALLAAEVAGLDLHIPLYCTPNGVDEDFFQRLRPRVATAHLVVGHVGKPNPRKGVDLLLAAVNQARYRGADIELRLVQRTSKDALSPIEIREFYQDLHLLLVASDMDGTPNPALEAAACEVAVLGNRIGNLPEFIEDGVNGWLIEGLGPYGRADLNDGGAALVEAYAARLLEASANLPAVERMGVAARATVQDAWTWRGQAERVRPLWRAALA